MELDEVKDDIEFKSPLKGIHDLIFIASLLFSILIIIAAFNFKANFFQPIIFTAFAFALYYVTRYLTLSITIISVKDGFLQITQDCSLLNIYRSLSIPIDNLRGFEINQVTKGQNALFIYDQSFNYYKYSLIKTKDELAIKAYLSPYITFLDQKSNPYFYTFTSAFLFAIKQVFVFTLFSTSILISIYYLNEKYKFWLASWPYFVISLFISLLFWKLITRKQLKRKYFRFGAYYWLSSCFLFASVLIIHPIISIWKRTQNNIVTVNHPHHIFKYNHLSLFKINMVSTHPNQVLRSNFYIQSNGSRSRSLTINHYFITPLGGGEEIKLNAIYNVWLLKRYKQMVRKSLDPQTKQQMIDDFHLKSSDQFINSLRKHPIFYTSLSYNKEVVPLFFNNQNASKFTVALEPHWESITDYKKNNLKQILLLFACIITLNLFSSTIIAINR